MELKCRSFLSVFVLQVLLVFGDRGSDDDDSKDHRGHGHGGGDDDSISTTPTSTTPTSTTPTTSTTSSSLPKTPMSTTISMTTSSTSQSSSSSTPHPTQTALSDTTPMIHFAAPSNISTCDSTTFFWTPVGPTITISLLVTDVGVSESTSTESITESITTVSSNTQLFTWFDVDVPEGWYLVLAQLVVQPKTVLARSAPFFVMNGSDMSCVQPHSQNNPSPSQTPGPGTVGGHTNSHIIGAVFAGVAALVILTVAFMFPRWWRRALPSNRKRRLLY